MICCCGLGGFVLFIIGLFIAYPNLMCTIFNILGILFFGTIFLKILGIAIGIIYYVIKGICWIIKKIACIFR
jgi:hypothetical protein